jgi:hypothetical protein
VWVLVNDFEYEISYSLGSFVLSFCHNLIVKYSEFIVKRLCEIIQSFWLATRERQKPFTGALGL